MEIALEWSGDLRFRATTKNDVEITLDGDGEAGPSPVESLLFALAGCLAADVVSILEKGRQNLDRATVALTAERREEPPRRLTVVRMTFTLEGEVDPAKAERAIDLSRSTYCSVLHSLANDIDVDVVLESTGIRG